MSIELGNPATPEMTLLDYFAAKAMHAHQLAWWQHYYNTLHTDSDDERVFGDEDTAEMAYEMAVEMLIAREK